MEEGGKDRLLVLIVHQKGKKRKRYSELESELASRLEMVGLRLADEDTAKSVLADDAFRDAVKKRFDSLGKVHETLSVRYFLLGLGDLDYPADQCPNFIRFFFVDLKRREVLSRFGQKLDGDKPCRLAAQLAAGPIFSRISADIAGKGVIDRSRIIKIQVVIRGINRFSDIVRLQKVFRDVPLVRSVTMNSFASGGEVQFWFEYEGRPEDLASALKKIRDKGFRLREVPGPRDRLTFRVTYWC